MSVQNEDVLGNSATLIRSQYQYGVALFVVCALLALASFHDVETWKATHWAFSYDAGFVKRGFVGTLYQYFEYPVSQTGVATAYLAVSGFAVGLFIYLVAKTFGPAADASLSRDFAASVTGLWLISAPGFVPQLAHDMGRFDVFGIVFLLVCVVAVHERSKKESFAAVTVLSAVSIYIHEAFFFWIPAVAIALWMYRHHESRSDTLLVVLFAAVMFSSTLYNGLSTYADSFSTLGEAVASMEDKTTFWVDPRSVNVHFRSLIDNVERARERGWRAEKVERLTMVVPVFLPYLVLFWIFGKEARKADPDRRAYLYVLFASVAAPVALFVLGSDFGRWLSMINVSAVAVIVFLVRAHPAVTRMIPPGAVWLMVVATVLQANLGPFGIEWVFPYAHAWSTIEAIRAAVL